MELVYHKNGDISRIFLQHSPKKNKKVIAISHIFNSNQVFFLFGNICYTKRVKTKRFLQEYFV